MGDGGQFLLHGLRDEHSVKGVLVMGGKGLQGCPVTVVKRQMTEAPQSNFLLKVFRSLQLAPRVTSPKSGQGGLHCRPTATGRVCGCTCPEFCKKSPGMASKQNIPVLSRTLRLLEAVTDRGMATAKELSMDLGVPLATCYRILNTLTTAQWLRRNNLGQYRVSLGISRLGGLAADMARFFAISHPILRELAETTRAATKISVREGDDWLILARFVPPDTAGAPLSAGSRDHVAVGSVGAVLLHHLPDDDIRIILQDRPELDLTECHSAVSEPIACCREHGYATDFGVTNPQIYAVSIPVDLSPLEELAALTAFGIPDTLPPENLPTTLAALRHAAHRIQIAMG